jgi:hypothetical protein
MVQMELHKSVIECVTVHVQETRNKYVVVRDIMLSIALLYLPYRLIRQHL